MDPERIHPGSPGGIGQGTMAPQPGGVVAPQRARQAAVAISSQIAFTSAITP